MIAYDSAVKIEHGFEILYLCIVLFQITEAPTTFCSFDTSVN